MHFRMSRHASEEIERRGIPFSVVERVMTQPDQVVLTYGARTVFQSLVDFPEGRAYLVRVVVDDAADPPIVITAYRTTKVAKYWRYGREGDL